MAALHSMVRVLSKTSRLPHLLHRICKVETLKGQAHVSNTDATLQNHFRLLKYYTSELSALGTAHECLEGTYLIASQTDVLAEKLLQTWLHLNQIEQLDPMLSEISSLKSIFKQSVSTFHSINMEWLTTLVELVLETQGGIPSSEANAIFSPPKKPNLSPITSQKRISSVQSDQSSTSMTFSPRGLKTKMLPPKSGRAQPKTGQSVQSSVAMSRETQGSRASSSSNLPSFSINLTQIASSKQPISLSTGDFGQRARTARAASQVMPDVVII